MAFTLTIESSIGELLDDPKVYEYMSTNLPVITDHPNLEMAKAMPFNVVATMASDRISMDDVADLEAFLESLQS
jgi:hypothetical protein